MSLKYSSNSSSLVLSTRSFADLVHIFSIPSSPRDSLGDFSTSSKKKVVSRHGLYQKLARAIPHVSYNMTMSYQKQTIYYLIIYNG